MSWVQGYITPCWTVEEISKLDYFHEPFNDIETQLHWQSIYGQSFGIGLQADYRSHQPEYTQEIVNAIIQQIGPLTCISTSYYCMMPGDILPFHKDTYKSYCQYHNVSAQEVIRIIVFINSWQPGFLFEIDGTPIVNYKSGNFVAWNYDTEHMAGNIGITPRYTLQITGVRNVK